jgi:copper chaperone
MKTENITIANLSCGGCVNTISKKLASIAGVEKVEVDLETNTVSISHNEITGREEFTKALLSLGYPEATLKNGLLTQLKSVASCLSGKLSS